MRSFKGETVYLTGTDDRQAHLTAAEDLTAAGVIVLTPALLPENLKHHTKQDICHLMLIASSGIVLLPGWEDYKPLVSELNVNQGRQTIVQYEKWVQEVDAHED